MTEEPRTPEENNEDSKDTTSAEIEKFVISNSNGNGINPNPIESGNSGDWDKGVEESEKYKSDAEKKS